MSVLHDLNVFLVLVLPIEFFFLSSFLSLHLEWQWESFSGFAQVLIDVVITPEKLYRNYTRLTRKNWLSYLLCIPIVSENTAELIPGMMLEGEKNKQSGLLSLEKDN